MVCAPTEKQKTVANIPTLIPSFVIASLFGFIQVWWRGMLRASVRRGGRTACKIVRRTVREYWPAFELQICVFRKTQAKSLVSLCRKKRTPCPSRLGVRRRVAIERLL